MTLNLFLLSYNWSLMTIIYLQTSSVQRTVKIARNTHAIANSTFACVKTSFSALSGYPNPPCDCANSRRGQANEKQVSYCRKTDGSASSLRGVDVACPWASAALVTASKSAIETQKTPITTIADPHATLNQYIPSLKSHNKQLQCNKQAFISLNHLYIAYLQMYLSINHGHLYRVLCTACLCKNPS